MKRLPSCDEVLAAYSRGDADGKNVAARVGKFAEGEARNEDCRPATGGVDIDCLTACWHPSAKAQLAVVT